MTQVRLHISMPLENHPELSTSAASVDNLESTSVNSVNEMTQVPGILQGYGRVMQPQLVALQPVLTIGPGVLNPMESTTSAAPTVPEGEALLTISNVRYTGIQVSALMGPLLVQLITNSHVPICWIDSKRYALYCINKRTRAVAYDPMYPPPPKKKKEKKKKKSAPDHKCPLKHRRWVEPFSPLY